MDSGDHTVESARDASADVSTDVLAGTTADVSALPSEPSHDVEEGEPPKYADFCNRLGILHYNVATQTWWSKTLRITLGDPVKPGTRPIAPILKPAKNSYYDEIRRAYRHHSWQYWFIASLVNTLYLTQVVIGATATTLGSVGVATRATQKRTTAITILTAIGTVIAGILAFLKSRGQPNRVRQLRNDLRKVCDYIRFMEMEFQSPGCQTSVDAALKQVKDRYDTARANAETNYPDTWSTPANTPSK